MATLEARIDDLYRLPLSEFVAARSALASEFAGAEARRVKGLKKPTVVPWSVNQVYWHARETFDRLLQAGGDLRRAQIAALQGKASDVRTATDAHRKAVASAVEQAVRLAEKADVHPSADQLARTFEAASLASMPPEPLGRLTQPLQPGGFEMLAGVDVSRSAQRSSAEQSRASARPHRVGDGQTVAARADVTAAGRPSAKERERQRLAANAERERQREAAEAARRRDKAIESAKADVDRAQKNEATAAEAWKRAKDDLEKARRTLADLQPRS